MIRYNRDLLHFIKDLSAVEPAIILKSYLPGQTVLAQGDTLYHVYIVQSGIAKCLIPENNGKSYILEFLGAGEIAGEIEVLNAANSLTTIEALTELNAFKIPRNYFIDLLKKDWSFNLLILRELATRLGNTAQRASYQQNYPLEYSILKLVFLFSEQPFQLKKTDLADYLGITLRSLNRALLALQKKQILDASNMALLVSSQQVAALLDVHEKD